MSESVSIRKVMLITGAICAFFIGSGFATGQEILQFFGANGVLGMFAVVLYFIVAGAAAWFITGAGKRENFKSPFDVFKFYCGKWLGRFYAWFSVVAMYCSLVVILAGGGATLNQFYNVPTYAGTIVIALLALGTALLGIKRLIEIIGWIGPFKVLMVFVLGVFSLVTLAGDPAMLVSSSEGITAAGFPTASPNWAWSGILYALQNIINIAAFLAASGATTKSIKEAKISGLVGVLAFSLTIVMLIIAEIIHYELFIGKQVPTLAIANYISPTFGLIFTIMISIAVYSAVTANLVMVSRKFAKDRTPKYTSIAIALTVVGVILAGTVPFDTLVNILFPILGYVAIIFIALVFYKELRIKRGSKVRVPQ